MKLRIHAAFFLRKCFPLCSLLSLILHEYIIFFFGWLVLVIQLVFFIHNLHVFSIYKLLYIKQTINGNLLCITGSSTHCSYCCCSVVQSCPTLCDPMDCSIPGLPVPHHRPEIAQVHIHFTGDAFQPSHLLMPSSSALNLSQHQGLFQ